MSQSQSTERITTINSNDIICGRKGVALKHPGNLAYRKIVGLNKELYATCMKNEKLRISKSIVAAMREVGGRFLERVDGKTSASLNEKDEGDNPVVYTDIGDKRAVEKTSQALREGQPKLLKKLAQAQEQVKNAFVPQGHHYRRASTMNMYPAAIAPSYGYDPYARQYIVPQSITPPPSTLLPPLMSQFETDLLFLTLLRRANGR